MNSELRCWGQNEQGDKPFVPEAVQFAKSVSTNYWGNICAINLRGEPYCWPAIDADDNEVQKLPEQFNNYEKILTGDGACLVAANGKIDCWDSGDVFPMIAPGKNALTVDYDLDGGIGCTVTLEGRIECLGYGILATSQNGVITGIYKGLETEYEEAIPSFFGKARDVSVGYLNACLVDEVGKISCWTLCKSQCHSDGLSTPTMQKALKVVTGRENGCAILEDRTITCWQK